MKHLLNYAVFEASKKEVKERFEEICHIFMEYMIHDDSFIRYKQMIIMDDNLYTNLLKVHADYFTLSDKETDAELPEVKEFKQLKLTVEEKNKIFYNLLVKDKRFTTDKSNISDIFNIIKDIRHTVDQITLYNFLPTGLARLQNVNNKKAISVMKMYFKFHKKGIVEYIKTHREKLFRDHTKIISHSARDTYHEDLSKMISVFYETFAKEFSTKEKLNMSKTNNKLYNHIIDTTKGFYDKKDKYLDTMSKLGIFDDD